MVTVRWSDRSVSYCPDYAIARKLIERRPGLGGLIEGGDPEMSSVTDRTQSQLQTTPEAIVADAFQAMDVGSATGRTAAYTALRERLLNPWGFASRPSILKELGQEPRESDAADAFSYMMGPVKPQPEPTLALAQIKAKFLDNGEDFWSHLRDGSAEENNRRLLVIEASIRKIVSGFGDAAYEAGQREAYACANADYQAVAKLSNGRMEEIQQLISTALERSATLTMLETENTGLHAEIARLRNPAPEPVKHVASPSIGARWGAPIGMLKEF